MASELQVLSYEKTELENGNAVGLGRLSDGGWQLSFIRRDATTQTITQIAIHEQALQGLCDLYSKCKDKPVSMEYEVTVKGPTPAEPNKESSVQVSNWTIEHTDWQKAELTGLEKRREEFQKASPAIERWVKHIKKNSRKQKRKAKKRA